MAFTHTIGMSWGSGARSLAANKAYTGDLQSSINQAVASDASELEVIVAIDVSEVEVFYMKSDVDLTVKTNSSGAPDDTIVLVANVPYEWTVDSYDSFLLSTDVTSLFLTNDSNPATAGTLELEVLADPTP